MIGVSGYNCHGRSNVHTGDKALAATDVFLSHARVDYETHARPLAAAFRRRSIAVWVDKAQIRPGESLTDAIGRGLDRARYVCVIITDAFLSRNWTVAELRNALAREIASGQTVVIPILAADHELTFARFPLLRDKLCLSWHELGPVGIADEIGRRLGRTPSRWWTHAHDPTHRGLVWTRVQPVQVNVGKAHEVTLLWGPLRYTRVLTFDGPDPLSMVHHKLAKDAVGLYLVTDLPVIATFGEGFPSDPEEAVLTIDEGWVRVAGAPLVRARAIDDLGEAPD